MVREVLAQSEARFERISTKTSSLLTNSPHVSERTQTGFVR